ncbi:MAG TPA: lysophospholipid acyltransferase family protein [Acidimicrobiales bacterium]|nr:lysophospholipid acyltransferase family protein [Acidimicrobiales bacterium]
MPVSHDEQSGVEPVATGASDLPGWLYFSLRALVRAVARLYWRVEVDGADQVPVEGPVILCPVHRSFMDFLVAAQVTRRRLHYMAKDELWRSEGFGRFLDSIGAFPVDRSGADRKSMARAQAVLEAGGALVLFPEGTRREGPVVENLHEGAAFLAARTGARLVPIGIGGTAEAMPKGSKLVRPVKVHVVVGKPLPPPARSAGGRVPRHQVHELTEQLRTELQRLYDQSQSQAGADGANRRRP